MKISNFYPEKINNSNELMFFDNCLAEYFKGVEFSLFGSIELFFSGGKFDFCNVSIMFSQDENGNRINLSEEIKGNIETELGSLFYNLKHN